MNFNSQDEEENNPFPEDDTYQDKKITPKYSLTFRYVKAGERKEIKSGFLEKTLQKRQLDFRAMKKQTF